mgnify:FL=1
MNHRIPSSARNRQYLARNGAVVLKDLIKNQQEAHPIIQIAGSLLQFAATLLCRSFADCENLLVMP